MFNQDMSKSQTQKNIKINFNANHYLINFCHTDSN